MSDMPEIKISHPIVMLDLTDVPQRDAIKLRNLLERHFKVRNISARVGYSDAAHAMRITIRSVDQSMAECDAVIRSTIAVWIDARAIDSMSTKKGRTVRW